MVNIGSGDLAIRLFQSPGLDVIVERLPMTIELTLFAMLFSTTVGIGLGICQRSDQMSPTHSWSANIGVSMPVFCWVCCLPIYSL